jgi:predicted PurR-regulated permease PerM
MSRPQITTSAPSEVSSIAAARPKPLPPPLIKIVSPASNPGLKMLELIGASVARGPVHSETYDGQTMEASPWYRTSEDAPSDRRILRAVATVLIVVFSLYLVYLLRTPLIWLLIAVFLAIAASGPVNVLHRHMKRGLAIAIVYICILLIPIGIGAALLPPLVSSTVSLVNQLPDYINDLEDTLHKDKRFEKIDQNFDVNAELTKIQQNLKDRIGTAATTLASIGEKLISSVFAAFTIFILSMFMVARGRGWIDTWIKNRAGPEAAALDRTVDRIGGAVGGYIGGALLQAFIAGLCAFIVLSILGIPSPLVLAAIVAAFDVVPMVGSTIAGVLVGAVTLFADFPIDTIIWGVFVIGYQQFENYVIQPKIQSRAVEMEPFVVLIAVLFGGTLMGVIGAILAIPIAATLQITYQEWRKFQREVAEMSTPDDAKDAPLGEPDPEPS